MAKKEQPPRFLPSPWTLLLFLRVSSRLVHLDCGYFRGRVSEGDNHIWLSDQSSHVGYISTTTRTTPFFASLVLVFPFSRSAFTLVYTPSLTHGFGLVSIDADGAHPRVNRQRFIRIIVSIAHVDGSSQEGTKTDGFLPKYERGQ